MLQIIEHKPEIRSAQKRLEKALCSSLSNQGKRNIGYPGGNTDNIVHSSGDGELYCAFAPPSNSAVPRYWNSFGIFREEAPRQQIAVEINVPVDGNSARVAGFFARHTLSGDVYLMHDGGIGGGRKGIGKAAFLNFISDPLVEVEGAQRTRSALMIANLDDAGLAALIWRFVQKVDAFKRVRAEVSAPSTSTTNSRDDYVPEFTGRKRGTRRGEFDYITYHGMVVDELKREIEARLAGGQKVNRDKRVDLFVLEGDRRTEIYEVKTSCDRQSLYTGIGQLMTHAHDQSATRTLVLPSDSDIPTDCNNALRRLGISVRRFHLAGQGVGTHVKLR